MILLLRSSKVQHKSIIIQNELDVYAFVADLKWVTYTNTLLYNKFKKSRLPNNFFTAL